MHFCCNPCQWQQQLGILLTEVTTPAQEADLVDGDPHHLKTTPDPTSIDFSNLDPEKMEDRRTS